MNTLEVGQRLVELLRAGKNLEVMDALYAPDIVSVEAGAPPGQDRTTTGVDACKQKGAMFRTRMEIMSINVEGPFPHDDRFAIFIAYDGTAKLGPTAGQRQLMKEVALYTVANGKIVREEFFYTMT